MNRVSSPSWTSRLALTLMLVALGACAAEDVEEGAAPSTEVESQGAGARARPVSIHVLYYSDASFTTIVGRDTWPCGGGHTRSGQISAHVVEFESSCNLHSPSHEQRCYSFDRPTDWNEGLPGNSYGVFEVSCP